MIIIFEGGTRLVFYSNSMCLLISYILKTDDMKKNIVQCDNLGWSTSHVLSSDSVDALRLNRVTG